MRSTDWKNVSPFWVWSWPRQRKGKESNTVTTDNVKHAIKEYFKRIGEENKKLLAGKSTDYYIIYMICHKQNILEQ